MDTQGTKMVKTVGISDMKTATEPEDVLITYSLGSCLGLSLFDPQARVGGLLHSLLPLSSLDAERAKQNPFMFADTGVTRFLENVFQLGARRENLIAKVAGCGAPLASTPAFNIGQRNWTVLRKVLWKNNILIAGEEVGGTAARTMILHMKTGKTMIKSGNSEHEL